MMMEGKITGGRLALNFTEIPYGSRYNENCTSRMIKKTSALIHVSDQNLSDRDNNESKVPHHQNRVAKSYYR